MLFSQLGLDWILILQTLLRRYGTHIILRTSSFQGSRAWAMWLALCFMGYRTRAQVHISSSSLDLSSITLPLYVS